MKRASIGNLFLTALAALALCGVCNAETQYMFMCEKHGNRTPLGSWSPTAPTYTDDRAVITDLTYTLDDPSCGEWAKVRAKLRFLGSGGEGASDAYVLVRMVDYRDRQMFQVRSGLEWVYAVNYEIEPRYDVEYTVEVNIDYLYRTYEVSVNGKPLSSCESGATAFALYGSVQCVSGVNLAGTTRFKSPLEGYCGYRSWTGAGSGTDWASGANWLGGSVPAVTISPRFESGAMTGGSTVSFSAAQSVNGDIIVNAGTAANPIVFTATGAANGLAANALRIGTRCGGAFSLNGGTLTVQKVVHGGGPDVGTFTLNGGTLKAASAGTLIEGSEKLNVIVGANGGMIDNNGKNITLAKAFGGNGKLILTGVGTNSIAGGNVLAGGIDVKGGCTLQVTPDKQVTSGGLAMAGGTTLVVPFGVAPTIGGALSATGSGNVSVRIGDGKKLEIGSYTILVSSGQHSFAGVVGRLSVVNPIAAGATASLAALGGRDQRLVLVVSNPGDYVWTGAGDNNYLNNPYNWSDRLVPNQGGETVVFGGTANTSVRCNIANFAPSNVVFGARSAKFTFGDGQADGMRAFTNVVKIVNKSAEAHVFNVPVHFKDGYFVDFETAAVNFAGGAYATTLDPETRDNAVSHRLTGVIHLTGDWVNPPALANPYTVPAGSQLYGVSMSGNRAQTVLCVDEGGYANFSGTVRTGNPCGRVSVLGEMDVGLWVVQGTGGNGHVAFDGDQSGSGIIRVGGVWKGDANNNMNKNVYVKIPHLYVGADGLGAKIKDYSIHFDGGNQTVHATDDFAIFGPRRAADLHDWGLSINTKTMFDTAGHTVTWTGGAQGAGAIVKAGAGTLYMNPYGSALSGAVTVSNGTVRIAKLDTNDPALGSGAMTVAPGATLAADFGAKTASLSLEAGATLDVAVCDEGAVPMTVTGSLTLPTEGKASLTRAGGAFGAGRYAIMQNASITPSEAFAGCEPVLADGLECGFRKDGDILGLVVYPAGTPPVWTGLSGDCKMSSGDNWGRGCAPRAGETARFNNTSAITVDADLGDITLRRLEMGSGVVTLTGNLRVSTLTNAYTLAVAQGASLSIEGDLVGYAANNTKPLLHSNYGTVTVGGQVHFRDCSDKNRALSTVVQYAVADENTKPIIANGLAHNACTKPDNNWYCDYLVADLGSTNGGVGKWVIGPGGMAFPAHRDIACAGFHAINGQAVVLYSSANWTLSATRQNKTNPAG
ncbi:MAG: hypothetical protein K6G91_12180, partial [Kiritimatiellae bacterium]|nr:hypothetical protein [Kiritimatiellia bacterium]